MARKKTIFKFKELSKAAREKAVQDFREKHETWFDFDSDDLTEQFKQILVEDHGFDKDVVVNWSLGYCQGDGVCFTGRLSLHDFIVKNKIDDKYYVLVPYSYANIKNNGRSCHENSMTVDYEVSGVEPIDFMSSEDQLDYHEWDGRRYRVEHRNREMEREYLQALREPANAAYLRWLERRGAGVKAWIPDPPPDPGNPPVVHPPQYLPAVPMPAHVAEAWARAEEKVKDIEEGLAPEFQDIIEETISDISRKLEKIGYTEIDYRTSDEYIQTELLENPAFEDLRFTEDGEEIED